MKMKVFFILLLLLSLVGCSSGYGPILSETALCSGDLTAIVTVHENDNTLFGAINEEGNWVIEPQYQQMYAFSEGKAAVKKDGKWGYIDYTGEACIPFQYDFAGSFSCGRACVYTMVDGELQEWFIDETGKKVFQMELGEQDWYTEFRDDLLLVCKDGKYGFLNKSGDVAIPFIYDYADDADQGLIRVKRDGKCGYIDIFGKEVIPVRYDNVSSIGYGDLIVAVYDVTTYRDENGQYAFVAEEGKDAIYDITGKLIYETDEYDLYQNDYIYGRGYHLDEDGREHPVSIYFDQSGNIVHTDMENDAAGYLRYMTIDKGYMEIRDENGQLNFYSKDGELLIEGETIKAEAEKIIGEEIFEYNFSYQRWKEDKYFLFYGIYDYIELETHVDRRYCFAAYDYTGQPVFQPTKADLLKARDMRYPDSDAHIFVEPLDVYGDTMMLMVCFMDIDYESPSGGSYETFYILYLKEDGSYKMRKLESESDDYRYSLWAQPENGKWGYLDPHGDWAIQPYFSWAGPFQKLD